METTIELKGNKSWSMKVKGTTMGYTYAWGETKDFYFLRLCFFGPLPAPMRKQTSRWE